jgi:folylpolyglutamate synthase/dihydropteroate synthase
MSDIQSITGAEVPGRIETVSQSPQIIIDGANNPTAPAFSSTKSEIARFD